MRKFVCIMSLLFAFAGMKATAQDPENGTLDRSGWTVSTSSWCIDSGTNGPAENIIDGNVNTYWHSNWSGDASKGESNTLPVFISLDLGQEETFDGFGYTPRALSGTKLLNGTCTEYKLYVSNEEFSFASEYPTSSEINAFMADTENNQPAMEGTISYDNATGQPTMTQKASSPMTGRYVLFVITAAASDNGGGFGSCAEFYLYSDADLAETYLLRRELNEKLTSWVGDGPGYIPASEMVYVQEVYDDPDATKEDLEQALIEFADLIPNMPESGKTYEIVSEFSGFMNNQGVEKAIFSNGSRLVWNTADLMNPAQYWTLTAWGNEDEFTAQNLADELFITSVSNMSTTQGTLKLVVVAPGAFNINVDGANQFHAIGHNSGKNVSGDVSEYGTLGSETSGPSTWYIREVTAERVKAAIPAFVEQIKSNIGNQIGQLSAEAVTALSEAASKPGVELGELVQQRNGITRKLPEAGKYYRLQNVSRQAYLGLDGDNARGTDENTTTRADLIWQLVPVEDGYKLMNCNTGNFMSPLTAGETATASVNLDRTNGALFRLGFETDLASNKIEIKDGNGATMHCESADKSGNSFGINSWDQGGDAGRWFIFEATDIEVALNVADASYATAYYPFAVAVTGNTKAYALAEKDGDATVLTATEVAEGKVPANTGVLLKNDEGEATATLSILTEAPAAVETALTGTNTAQEITDATEYYVFGNGDAGVGFYHPNTTTLLANKAYLHVAGSSAQAFTLSFGDTTTGIDGAQLSTEAATNAPYYDLSGRRVLRPAKGLYIHGGKKVYIK